MNSALTTVVLPLVLGVIMFGLGLSITTADLHATLLNKRLVIIALFCQTVLLPIVCLAVVLIFRLSPVLSVGLLLLAASPGGASASLFSHLFRGDVTLNLSVTALNSVLAIVTLPLTVNLSLTHFMGDDTTISLQTDKVIQVIGIIVIPVVFGMIIRRYFPAFADMMDKPVRVAAAIVLTLLAVAAIAAERYNVVGYLTLVGAAAVTFGVTSLLLGYSLSRLARGRHPQAVAISMEVGVHNGALAITIAVNLLHNPTLAVPAAIYTLLQPLMATAIGYLLVTRHSRAPS